MAYITVTDIPYQSLITSQGLDDRYLELVDGLSDGTKDLNMNDASFNSVDAGSFLLSSTDINTAGTLTNVAYKTGTPVNNQLAVWTNANVLEGDSNLTWDGTSLVLNGINLYIKLGDESQGQIWVPYTDSLVLTNSKADADIVFQVNDSDGGGVQNIARFNGQNFYFLLDANAKITTGGETAPDCDIGGITLQQGSASGYALTIKSSSVAHGGCGFSFETDTFFSIRKYYGLGGGNVIYSMADSDASKGTSFEIRALSETTIDTTTGSSGVSVVQLYGAQHNGSNVKSAVANAGNLFGILNNGTAVEITKGNGDKWLAGDLTCIEISASGDITGFTDLYTADWADYFSSSTIVGWSGTPTGYIYYKKVGKLVFVDFVITGTSNSTSVSFTLPYTSTGSVLFNFAIQATDNGTPLANSAHGQKQAGTNVVACFKTWDDLTAWTNSNQKRVSGQFWYQAA